MDFFGGRVKARGFLVCLLVATSVGARFAATTATTTKLMQETTIRLGNKQLLEEEKTAKFPQKSPFFFF